MNAIFTPSSAEPTVPPVDTLPLDRIDVSDARLFEQNLWEPYFARLRDEDPVHYIEDSPFGPFWSITRYDDIVYVDSNHQLFSSEPFIVIGERGDDLPIEMFIAMDPPKHDEQRNAVQSVVAPKNLAELERVIRERVIKILDGLPVGETFNWVEKVSVELTAQMLATIFGFPFEERHKLIHWSDLMAALPEMTGADVDPEYRVQELLKCVESFTALWHQRLAENKDGEMSYDLISLMQSSDATKDILDRPMEFMGNLGLLIVGGNDTTRNSISGGVLALNENPEEYQKLRDNPGLIPNMVSEIIRWQTPLAHMRRIATEDVELGGKTIKKGDKVVMWYVSGNRDERSIDNPNQFIIDRKNARRHISFGFGVHRCMGNRLAEMQLRILWEEILKRFDKVEVVGEPVRVRSNFVKGFTELPVRLIPVS
jgi:cytochrome P450